jgi:hypothetical protein
MDRTFDAAPLDSHCIPTKRRRFPDQSAVTAPYAAAMSGSDTGTRAHARWDWMGRLAVAIAHCLDNLAGAILGHANSTQLVEVRAWTRC